MMHLKIFLEVMKQLQDANNTIKSQDKQIKQLQAGKLLQNFSSTICQHFCRHFIRHFGCTLSTFCQQFERNRLP